MASSPRIEDFDLGQLIGRGGFAQVYRSFHRPSGREFALKIIRKQCALSATESSAANEDAENAATRESESAVQTQHWQRIQNEISIHSRLAHPHVVQCFACFEDALFVYLVLELCEGETLFRYLRRQGRLGEREALFILSHLLSALEYLHAQGVIHRDLKLSNILLVPSASCAESDGGNGDDCNAFSGNGLQHGSNDFRGNNNDFYNNTNSNNNNSKNNNGYGNNAGEMVSSEAATPSRHRSSHHHHETLSSSAAFPYTVKLCDFGLATQLAHPDEEHYTLCGTPNYIAPEIVSQRAHSFAADIWSLGCLFYTLIVGTPPFEQHNVHDTLQHILRGEFDVQSLTQSLSPSVRDLVERMLCADPQRRVDVRAVLTHPLLTETLREERGRETERQRKEKSLSHSHSRSPSRHAHTTSSFPSSPNKPNTSSSHNDFSLATTAVPPYSSQHTHSPLSPRTPPNAAPHTQRYGTMLDIVQEGDERDESSRETTHTQSHTATHAQSTQMSRTHNTQHTPDVVDSLPRLRSSVHDIQRETERPPSLSLSLSQRSPVESLKSLLFYEHTNVHTHTRHVTSAHTHTQEERENYTHTSSSRTHHKHNHVGHSHTPSHKPRSQHNTLAQRARTQPHTPSRTDTHTEREREDSLFRDSIEQRLLALSQSDFSFCTPRRPHTTPSHDSQNTYSRHTSRSPTQHAHTRSVSHSQSSTRPLTHSPPSHSSHTRYSQHVSTPERSNVLSHAHPYSHTRSQTHSVRSSLSQSTGSWANAIRELRCSFSVDTHAHNGGQTHNDTHEREARHSVVRHYSTPSRKENSHTHHTSTHHTHKHSQKHVSSPTDSPSTPHTNPAHHITTSSHIASACRSLSDCAALGTSFLLLTKREEVLLCTQDHYLFYCAEIREKETHTPSHSHTHSHAHIERDKEKSRSFVRILLSYSSLHTLFVGVLSESLALGLRENLLDFLSDSASLEEEVGFEGETEEWRGENWRRELHDQGNNADNVGEKEREHRREKEEKKRERLESLRQICGRAHVFRHGIDLFAHTHTAHAATHTGTHAQRDRERPFLSCLRESSFSRSVSLSAAQRLPALLCESVVRAAKLVSAVRARIPKLVLYLTPTERHTHMLSHTQFIHTKSSLSSLSVKCTLMCNVPLADCLCQWSDGTRLTYSLHSSALSVFRPAKQEQQQRRADICVCEGEDDPRKERARDKEIERERNEEALRWDGCINLSSSSSSSLSAAQSVMASVPEALRAYLIDSQRVLLQCLREERRAFRSPSGNDKGSNNKHGVLPVVVVRDRSLI